MDSTNINQLLSFFTLLADLLIIFFLFYFIYITHFNKKKSLQSLIQYFNGFGSWLILTISVVATLGSLFFSEIAGYNPCLLCWYQRIFMYPLVIASIILIWNKTKEMLYFIMSMSLLGIIFATYHYFIRFLTPIIMCSIDGFNCAIREFISFGYITIPMMSLTAFIGIFSISSLLLYFSKKK